MGHEWFLVAQVNNLAVHGFVVFVTWFMSDIQPDDSPKPDKMSL